MDYPRYKDDRTAEDRYLDHVVFMNDTFMSNWGPAEGTTSVAGWACAEADVDNVEEWVRSRSDASRVRVVKLPVGKTYRHEGLVHIYAVRDGHPALSQAEEVT